MKSGWENFVIPGFAYSQPIDANSVLGRCHVRQWRHEHQLSRLDRQSRLRRRVSGVYCGGKAGVNLNQMFISVGYSQRSGNWQWGIAPIFALQMFDAKGLGAFGLYGFSSSPGNLTNRGIDYSYGGGVRVGAIWNGRAELPRLAGRLDADVDVETSASTRACSPISGAFDIPANVTRAGLGCRRRPGR